MSNGSKEIAGVNIGLPGASRSEVVEAFLQKGAKLAVRTVPHFRGGRTSGNALEVRVVSGQMLVGGTPFKKDELYQRISHTATDPKLRLPNKRFPHRYSSKGFIDRVALGLGTSPIILDRTLRSMRAEIVMSVQAGLPPHLLETFQATVDRFLNERKDPYTVRKSPTLQNLIHLRETGTVFAPDNFYELIYQHTSNKFIGSWVTNEVDWLDQFYTYRMETRASFSPLDREVLERNSQGDQGVLPPALTRQTGIHIDGWVIANHTNALLGQIII